MLLDCPLKLNSAAVHQTQQHPEKKSSGMLRIEPGAVGCKTRMLSIELCSLSPQMKIASVPRVSYDQHAALSIVLYNLLPRP